MARVFARVIASTMVCAMLMSPLLSLHRRLESAMEDAKAGKDKAEALTAAEREEVSLVTTQ